VLVAHLARDVAAAELAVLGLDEEEDLAEVVVFGPAAEEDLVEVVVLGRAAEDEGAEVVVAVEEFLFGVLQELALNSECDLLEHEPALSFDELGLQAGEFSLPLGSPLEPYSVADHYFFSLLKFAL